MWKNLTRGVRETLERRLCRTNVYSQTQNEENNTNICSKKKSKYSNLKSPCFDLAKYQNSFCELFKNRGAKDKRNYSDWNECAQRSINDVLGWSGILALGWVICQSPCIRKHIFERNRRNEKKCYFSQFQTNNISHLLLNSLNLQPKHILPVINCIPNANTNNNNEFFKRDDEWLRDEPIGPITAEEALGASKENFTAIHQIVMSELELQVGVKALNEKQYTKAIEHFTTGAKLSSPGSMFNLGLCYQLGLGTPSDTHKAAKFYKEAAKRGHADAMYNLGVFYAQGRGGIVKNKHTARNLFTKAANLGHHDAKTALETEKLKAKEKALAASNKTLSTVPSKAPTNDNIFEHTISIFSSNISYDDDDLYDSSYKPYYSVNKFGNNDYYLSFLGIQPKCVPILMEAVQ